MRVKKNKITASDKESSNSMGFKLQLVNEHPIYKNGNSEMIFFSDGTGVFYENPKYNDQGFIFDAGDSYTFISVHQAMQFLWDKFHNNKSTITENFYKKYWSMVLE